MNTFRLSARLSGLIITTAMSFTAVTAIAADEAAKDEVASIEALTAPCAACHGADGNSEQELYPIIAGQHESYLIRALKEYRSGGRNDPLMSPMAVNLSDRDIRALAAWYASQESELTVPDTD